MFLFETILLLLFGATILSLLAQRVNIPYPTLLALGGTALVFVPGVPEIDLHSDLVLALFVAPILLDAAFDASWRDLKHHWRPVFSLVFVAVGITTAAVAIIARKLFPDIPWAAAIALGALLAPPDAIAALAVLRHVNPPHHIRKILEGESLLNDASSLLIYKFAVGAVATGSFSMVDAVPTFVVVIAASIVLGWLLAYPVVQLTIRIKDRSVSVILQFVTTFGIWLLAEELGLSAVITIVVFGLTAARHTGLSAHMRVPAFAFWEIATFVLNVLAFTLIGLQLAPILKELPVPERLDMLLAALIILAVVMFVRLGWLMIYTMLKWNGDSAQAGDGSTFGPAMRLKSGLVIGWSGMRGIVTLAAAMALPDDFPYHDWIQLTAFVVALGTLVLQGLTLGPLVRFLRLPADTMILNELKLARSTALQAAITELEADGSPAAARLISEYQEALNKAADGFDPYDNPTHNLRQRVVPASRKAIDELRTAGTIGDDAYRMIEEELDLQELSSSSPHTS
ncbi:MAG: sodium:proton antiporter [Pseudomonadota bacterium]